MQDNQRHFDQFADDYVHGLMSADQEQAFEEHCEQCDRCRVAQRAAVERFELLRSLNSGTAPESLITRTLKRVEASSTTQNQPKSKAWLHGRVAWGFWSAVAASVLLVASLQLYYGTLRANPIDLVVFGQETIDAGVQASLRVVVRHAHTGRPLAGVPLSIELSDHRAEHQTRLAMLTTDEHGSVSPNLTIPTWPRGDYDLIVRADVGRREELIRRRVKLRRAAKVMLSSDKPVYQPGQVIRLRSLSLSLPHRKPVAGESVEFQIRDPKGNVIFKRRVTTSRFGIASADCTLATELIEGAYRVSCAVGETESELTIAVERYVLPKFRIEATSDRPYYQPGESVRLRIKSEYFFGKPLSNAVVEAAISLDGHPSTPLEPRRGQLDETGQVELTIPLPEMVVGDSTHDGDARLSIDVRVTDSAGQEENTTVRALVTNRPLRVEAFHELGALVPGVANRIFFFTTYADGKPAPARLKVSGVRQEVSTSHQGVAEVEVTPAQERLTLEVHAVDQNGLTAHRQITLASERPAGQFVIRTDRSVYDAGDTLRVLALGHGKDPVFVDLLKDGQTLLTTSLEMDNGQGELAFDLPAEIEGTIQVCGYRFLSNGRIARKTLPVIVRSANQVNVTTRFDREEYRPGQPAELEVQLTDGDGRSVPGAVSLALVDQAVFAVTARQTGLEQAFFALDEALMEPTFTLYRDLWVQRNDESDSLQLFARASLARASAQALPTKAARHPHSLSARSFPGKVAAVESAKRRGLRVVSLAWGIVAAVAMLGATGMFIRTALQAGLIVMIVFVLALLLLPAAYMTHTTARKAARVGALQFSLSEQASADGAEAGSGAVRIRRWFPETLLWRPQVITDDNGRAVVQFDLADSITDWRLTASAVTADGALGATIDDVRAFQPFFVDLDLPVALIRNDEVSMPVVVYNYQDQAQTVELTLDEADWFELLDDESTRVVELQPGEVSSIHFRIKVTDVGLHQLTVRAMAQSGVADSVQRKVQVDPNGQRVENVVSGSLQDPVQFDLPISQDAVPGSVKAIVKIYPSAFSQLVEGLEGILQRPRGCFEQTSSTTYPNVLALDYLRKTRQNLPEIEAKARQFIHLGYQRLLTFEVSGGGFDWFGNPPAHELLTAYGLMEFCDMARVHDVDPALIERTRQWLFQRRQADGSWQLNGQALHDDPTTRVAESMRRLTATAYIAWAVYQGAPDVHSRATLEFLLRHEPAEIDSPYVLALVCNAICAIDAECPALKSYIERLVSLRRTDAGLAWWQQPGEARTVFYGGGAAADIEATAMAALALLAADAEPEVLRQALSWLLTQKDEHGTWHSTQATVLALKAILAGTGAPLDGGRERRVEVMLDGELVHEFVISKDDFDVVQQHVLEDQRLRSAQRLTVRESTESASAFQIVLRHHLERPPATNNQAPFEISVDYDTNRLRVQEAVNATVTVQNRTGATAPMLMVDVPIPAGFAVDPDSLAEFEQRQDIAKHETTPRSIILYLRHLAPQQTIEFRYRLRALMPVHVTTPPARTYLYYDPSQQATDGPQELIVTL